MKRSCLAWEPGSLKIPIESYLESKRLVVNFQMCIAMLVVLCYAGFLMAPFSRIMRIERLLLPLPICAEKPAGGKGAFDV